MPEGPSVRVIPAGGTATPEVPDILELLSSLVPLQGGGDVAGGELGAGRDVLPGVDLNVVSLRVLQALSVAPEGELIRARNCEDDIPEIPAVVVEEGLDRKHSHTSAVT